MSEKIRWAIRYGTEPRWYSGLNAFNCDAAWTWTKRARKVFDSRQAVYFECSRLAAGENMAPRVVKVRIVRKPKAKPVSREVWEGTSREFDADHRQHHVRHSNGSGSSCLRFASWLSSNVNKRVRVTLEVLP